MIIPFLNCQTCFLLILQLKSFARLVLVSIQFRFTWLVSLWNHRRLDTQSCNHDQAPWSHQVPFHSDCTLSKPFQLVWANHLCCFQSVFSILLPYHHSSFFITLDFQISPWRHQIDLDCDLGAYRLHQYSFRAQEPLLWSTCLSGLNFPAHQSTEKPQAHLIQRFLSPAAPWAACRKKHSWLTIVDP